MPANGLAVDQKLIKHRERGEVRGSQSLEGCERISLSLKDPKHSIGGWSGPTYSGLRLDSPVTRTERSKLMGRGRQAP